jgi:RHS repeat-associated protein
LEGDWNNTIVNGLTENRTHNEVHELTARDATALTYDAKGNLTGNPTREQTYQWDYENRMRLLIKSGTGSYNYSYRYDALGRRVGWTRKNGTNPNGGGQTKTMVFVSAGMQEVAEYEQGSLKRIYVYGSYIDEPLMMTPIGGGPVKKYYYHANNLYNVSAITDKNGAVVERYNYSPYGEATILDAAGTTVLGASTIANPWTFTGRRLDAETGLMYYRARYYDASLGRFTSRDPLEYVDGLNLYQYVSSDPLNWSDPNGYKKVTARVVVSKITTVLCGQRMTAAGIEYRWCKEYREMPATIEMEYECEKGNPRITVDPIVRFDDGTPNVSGISTVTSRFTYELTLSKLPASVKDCPSGTKGKVLRQPVRLEYRHYDYVFIKWYIFWKIGGPKNGELLWTTKVEMDADCCCSE